MSKPSGAGVLLALESFVTAVNGERLTFSKGDPIEADHPAVKANPHLFGPLVFRHPVGSRVEQATAAPGEKRTLKAPRKATPAEEAAIAETVEAEPKGKPLTTASFRGR